MKQNLLWICVLLLMLAGCSSSDNDENDNNPLFSNMLQISNDENADTGIFTVTNNKFYIDKMPVLDNNCPRFIFHCGIEKSFDLRELVIRIMGYSLITLE